MVSPSLPPKGQSMINVIIKMIVSADKRNEVLITLKELLDQIRYERGCVSCHCYLDVEAEDVVIIVHEWKSDEALAAHFRSSHFRVLRGAMEMLAIEPVISINTFVATKGFEAITAAQGG